MSWASRPQSNDKKVKNRQKKKKRQQSTENEMAPNSCHEQAVDTNVHTLHYKHHQNTAKLNQPFKSQKNRNSKALRILANSLSLLFASMASIPLSSLCVSQKPKSLSFSFVASDSLRFGSSSLLGFESSRKNRGIRVSVCRAASVVFRDLDADDFRHPLDKQVRL